MNSRLRTSALVLLLTLSAGSIAASSGCEVQRTGGSDTGAAGQPYPCGQNIASIDTFADAQDDMDRDPEGFASNAHDLAQELRTAAGKATDAEVKAALENFADVYDTFADQAAGSKPSSGDISGLEKTFGELEKASDRLDRACSS